MRKRLQIRFDSIFGYEATKNIEDNRRVYEGKDAFLWLSTSFGKSVHYEVLSFVCLTVNKERYLQGRVVTPLSC